MRTFLQRDGRGTVWSLALLISSLVPSSPLEGQDTNVTATMLRVLAETADEYRTGRPIFLVADYRFPHNVLPAFASRAQADSAKADSASYGVFGPFITPAEVIPDSVGRVTAVRVTIETPAGQRIENIDPQRADALFFRRSAIDKFVMPYYERLYGSAYAQRLRRNLGPVMGRHCFTNMCDQFMRRILAWDPVTQRPR